MNDDIIVTQWKDKSFAIRRGSIVLFGKPKIEILHTSFEGRGMIAEFTIFGGLVTDVFPNDKSFWVYGMGVGRDLAVIDDLASQGVTLLYGDGDRWLITPSMVADILARKVVRLTDQDGRVVRHLEVTKQFNTRISLQIIDKYLPMIGSNERVADFQEWPTSLLRSWASSWGFLDAHLDRALARNFFPSMEDITHLQKAKTIRKVGELKNTKAPKKAKKQGITLNRSSYYEPSFGSLNITTSSTRTSETGIQNKRFEHTEFPIMTEDEEGVRIFRYQIGHVDRLKAIDISEQMLTQHDRYRYTIDTSSLTEAGIKAFNTMLEPGVVICINELPELIVIGNGIDLDGDYPLLYQELCEVRLRGPQGLSGRVTAISPYAMDSTRVNDNSYTIQVNHFVDTCLPRSLSFPPSSPQPQPAHAAPQSNMVERLLSFIGTIRMRVPMSNIITEDDTRIIEVGERTDDELDRLLRIGNILEVMPGPSFNDSTYPIAAYLVVTDQFISDHNVAAYRYIFRRSGVDLFECRFTTADRDNKLRMAEFLANLYTTSPQLIPAEVSRFLNEGAIGGVVSPTTANSLIIDNSPPASLNISSATENNGRAIVVPSRYIEVDERNRRLWVDCDQLPAEVCLSLIEENRIIIVKDGRDRTLGQWQIKGSGYSTWTLNFRSPSGTRVIPPELAARCLIHLPVRREERPQSVETLVVNRGELYMSASRKTMTFNCANFENDELLKLTLPGTILKVVGRDGRKLNQFEVIDTSDRGRNDWGLTLNPQPNRALPLGMGGLIIYIREIRDQYRYSPPDWESSQSRPSIASQTIPTPTYVGDPAEPSEPFMPPPAMGEPVGTEGDFHAASAELFWRQNEDLSIQVNQPPESSMPDGSSELTVFVGTTKYTIRSENFKITIHPGNREITAHGRLFIMFHETNESSAPKVMHVAWAPDSSDIGWYNAWDGMPLRDRHPQLADYLSQVFGINRLQQLPASHYME